MIAKRRKKKKGGAEQSGAVATRVNKLANDAQVKGDKKYQQDLAYAKQVEKNASEDQKSFYNRTDKNNTYTEGYKRTAVNARPVANVQTQKQSGSYNYTGPVAGTDSKKVMRKRNPIKGIKKSEAKASVKRSMIRKMKSGY